MVKQLKPVTGVKGQTPMSGFNPLAAGKKVYGGGRPFPNVGKTGAAGKIGYNEREARRRAIINRQGGIN